MNFLTKLFSKKKESSKPKFDFKIGELLYLIDWEPYEKLIGQKNFEILCEIYIMRAWLYNYAFRRTISDVDLFANEMLNHLINELNTLGHSVFIIKCYPRESPEIDTKVCAKISDELMKMLLQRFEEYDELVQKHIEKKQDLEYVTVAFLKNVGGVIDNDNFSLLMKKMFDEVFKPASRIAYNAAKTYFDIK